MNSRRTLFRKSKPNRELVEALNAHAGLVIQAAARVLGSVHAAEDVAQDLAEKLLRSPPRDVRSWPALLKTMAVNAAIDRLRRQRKERSLDDVREAPANDDDPEQRFERAQKAGALRAAVAQLSERDALLFSLFYLADLSQRDIADQLSMTRSAVGVALHRVRDRLRQQLANTMGAGTAGTPDPKDRGPETPDAKAPVSQRLESEAPDRRR
ncbi:MAG: sigma-70 family RNA polymerase sigma factor [Pseudomonadota bacterium]